MEQEIQKEPKTNDSQPRGSLLQFLNVPIDWLLSLMAHWFGRVAESLERCGHHVLSLTTIVFAPWRWFPSKSIPEVDTQQEHQTLEGGGLTDSLEWFFAKISDTAGFLLTMVARIVLPVRFIESFEWLFARVTAGFGFFFSMLAQILLPKKFIQKAGEVHHDAVSHTLGFFVLFGERLGAIAEKLFPRRFFWPLYWLAGLFLDSLDFIAQWWYSRNFNSLAWATPAIMLLLPLGVAMSFTVRSSKFDKISQYQASLRAAEDAGDKDTVALCHAKLEQLGFEKLDRVEFKAAVDLAEEERFDEAYERIKKLAPLDEPGFVEAHVWIAGALLNNHITDDDPWELLRIHLGHALELDPEHLLAKRFSAELMMHNRDFENALTTMEETVRYFPSFHPDLAHLYRLKGDEKKCKFHARRALNHYRTIKAQQQRRNPEDANYPGQWTQRGYLRIAESCSLLGHQNLEVEILQEAVAAYPNNRMLQATLLQALIGRIATADLSKPLTRQWIETICEIMPNQVVVVAVLGRGLIAEEPEARELVEHLRAKNLLSSDVFERVADTYLSIGRFNKALAYYEETTEMNPKAGAAWNNMAWILGNVQPIQAERAVVAAGRAIELDPDPQYFETRGQILITLQRWDEAAKDLERALNGTVPNAAEVHRALAMSYEAMGNGEQAAAHRAFIDSAK